MEFIIIALSVINICITCYNHYLMKIFTEIKEDCEDTLIKTEFKINDLSKKKEI